MFVNQPDKSIGILLGSITKLAIMDTIMESFAKLIESLAKLAWPALVVYAIYKFYDPLKLLLNSVISRKITVKVGDNELTIDDASEQQRLLISDLQG